MKIIVLNESDFEQIKTLQETHINFIYGTLLSEFRDNLSAGNFIGCFDEERLVGYSGAAYNSNLKVYTTLMTVVDRTYWHLGIGTALIKEVLLRIPSDKELYFEAWTFPPKAPNAHRLLAQMNFQLKEIITNEQYASIRERERCVYWGNIGCKCEIDVYCRKGMRTYENRLEMAYGSSG